MVYPAFFKQAQRTDACKRKTAFYGFVRVVEIYQQRFAVACFDKAVCVSVKFFFNGFPSIYSEILSVGISASKWATEPAFETGILLLVSQYEYVFVIF